MNNDQWQIHRHLSKYTGTETEKRQAFARDLSHALDRRYHKSKIYAWTSGGQPVPRRVAKYLRRDWPLPCDRCEKYVRPEDTQCPDCGLIVDY